MSKSKTKIAYTILTFVLLLATVYLYAKGLRLRFESFSVGLSYILAAVISLGLSIVSGIMALLEPDGNEHPR
ncbi:MAG: hypothetical protein ACYCZ6_18280, partial [Polaromonas sp.]